MFVATCYVLFMQSGDTTMETYTPFKINKPSDYNLSLAKNYQDAASEFWHQSRRITENKGSAELAAKYELWARMNYMIARDLMRVEVL